MRGWSSRQGPATLPRATEISAQTADGEVLMNYVLVLFIFFIAPLAMAVAGFSLSNALPQPRPAQPRRRPTPAPEETELEVTSEVRILPVTPPWPASVTNQQLLRQAFLFREQHRGFGLSSTAMFLANKLNQRGVPAEAVEIEVGYSSIEDVMALLARFFTRNAERELVVIACRQGASAQFVHESYLVVAISPELRLYPILQSILGQDWHQRALASAINQLKPHAA